jgi:hypothetical protein
MRGFFWWVARTWRVGIDCHAEDDDLFWNMMIGDSVIMG